MFNCFERHGAWLQPMKVLRRKGTIWEVQFPEAVRKRRGWRSGPVAENSFEAMLANFRKNNYFPGWQVLGRGSGDSFLDEDLLIGLKEA